MTYDVLLWLCEKVYLILLNILLVPVAILGLFFDKLRRLLRKVSDDVAFFHSTNLIVSDKTKVVQTESRTKSKFK